MATGIQLTPLYVPGGVSGADLAGVAGPAVPTGLSGGPAGVDLVTLGLFRAVGQSESNAAGVATVTFGPVPSGRMWLIQRYVVSVTGSPGSVCSLYIGAATTPQLEDGTNRGDLDVADGDPPLFVPSGELVIFQWAGAGVGNTATARMQFAEALIGGG